MVLSHESGVLAVACAVIGCSWGVAEAFNLLWRLVMRHVWNATRRLLREEEGVTAIEYGLIAALIAVAIIVSVDAVGAALTTTFEAISTALTGAGE